ncbi:MAG: ATP-binding cassette domain-containing protein, partial [Propionibacteriaceae bacterium]|nr:ATP-binding cassette domain-containing protein [Propionibacteriaceae bacterium]
MLQVKDIEVRAGARLLLSPVSFQIIGGDRIGLVGRNGAGKTTLTRILAGEGQPAGGTVQRTGQIGYLPQDPRSGDPEQLARDRILGARGLDQVMARMRRAEETMSTAEGRVRDEAMAAYSRAENAFIAAGGYAAESEAARIAANLG